MLQSTHDVPAVAVDPRAAFAPGPAGTIGGRLGPWDTKTALWLCVLAVSYTLAIWVGLVSASSLTHTSVMWPASGVALAACYSFGVRAWPGVWLVYYALNLWMAAGPSGLTFTTAAAAASIAFGSTLQAGAAAAILRRRVGAGRLFVPASAIFAFLGVAVFAGVIAPTWTALTLWTVGASAHDYLTPWPLWWLGDVTGMLVFAPLLLQWRSFLRVSRRRGWIAEAIGTCLAVIAIGGVVYFDTVLFGNPQYLLSFVTLPCVVWIAFRFRTPGVALTTAFVSAIAFGAMLTDGSPFANDLTPASLLLFQVFSALVSVTGLALGASVAAQRQAERALRGEKARYLDLYENAPDMLASIDAATGVVTECNETLAKFLGIAQDAIVGQSVFDLYHEESRDIARRTFETFQQTGEVRFSELALARRNGSRLEVSMTASAVRDGSGRILSARTSWRDITARKIAERTLEESQQLWRAFIEQAPASMAMFDCQMRYLAVSRRFLSDAGLPPETELYGASHYAVFPNMPQHWKEAHDRALAGGVVTAEEDRFETSDGRVQWLRWEVRPWYDVNGLAGVVVFTEDESKRKQASDDLRKLNAELEERVKERTAQLEQLANEMEERSLTDQLTGLPNRRALDHKLAVELRLAVRHHVPLSLVMLDVDHFKQYNDSFGHPEGDELLRTLGQVLQDSVRTTDFAARWGGEEFAVLLRHTNEAGARVVAERIREAVEQRQWKHRAVTVSVGVATLWRFMQDSGALLSQADRALYEAKRRGRNRVVSAPDLSAHEEHGQNQKSA